MLSIDITYNESWKWSNNSVWVRKIILNKTGDYTNSNQSKIFQRNICFKIQMWWSMLCDSIRNPPHVSFCEISKQLLSRIILGGCLCKESRGRGGCTVTLVVSGFHFFPGHIFITSWNNLLSPQIFCKLSP